MNSATVESWDLMRPSSGRAPTESWTRRCPDPRLVLNGETAVTDVACINQRFLLCVKAVRIAARGSPLSQPPRDPYSRYRPQDYPPGQTEPVMQPPPPSFTPNPNYVPPQQPCGPGWGPPPPPQPPKKKHRVRNVLLGLVGLFVILIAIGVACRRAAGGSPPGGRAASGRSRMPRSDVRSVSPADGGLPVQDDRAGPDVSVRRTYQHANRDVLVEGELLPTRLRRSRTQK